MESTLRVHLALQSRNEKTGPIPVSTTSALTCPPSCPLSGNGGCYAAGGPLGMHWRQVTNGLRGADWSTFCDAIESLPSGQLWRHNQAGDLPGEGDKIDSAALRRLVKANRGKRGFTYTHKPARGANAKAIAAANAAGFTINLSANNPAHADQLAALDIGPVVTVLPASVNGAETRTLKTPAGRTISVCPATYRDDVNCASCGLCQRRDNRSIVGFPAHGAAKRKASIVASA